VDTWMYIRDQGRVHEQNNTIRSRKKATVHVKPNCTAHGVGEQTIKRDTRWSSVLYRSALVQLACVRHTLLKPETYLAASGEMMGLVLVVCSVVTALLNPEDFQENALAERFGYSNFCVVHRGTTTRT